MIKERLLSLPGEILKLKLDLLDKQVKLRNLKERQSMWELAELAIISNEVDENGKPKYSNDTKRKAELQHRIDTSEEYAEIEVSVLETDKAVALQTIHLEKLLNEQSNLRSLCRLEGVLND